MSGFSNPVGIICQGEGQQVSGFSNPVGIICQGEGQQVSGFSGESTLGEHFTPRCEEKWPIKVPIFEGEPVSPLYFRGTLKK